jgi:hypothetical protein
LLSLWVNEPVIKKKKNERLRRDIDEQYERDCAAAAASTTPPSTPEPEPSLSPPVAEQKRGGRCHALMLIK